MNKTIILITVLIASMAVVGCKKSAKESAIERQQKIISLREQMEKELGFTIELVRDDDDLDSLLVDTSNLPSVGEIYGIYICWLDEPAAPGALGWEKLMARTGSTLGTGRHPMPEDLLPSSDAVKFVEHSWVETSSMRYILRDRNRGGGKGPNYESGRVCAMAASNKGIYVSNIITVPEKQQDTAEPQEASEAE